MVKNQMKQQSLFSKIYKRLGAVEKLAFFYSSFHAVLPEPCAIRAKENADITIARRSMMIGGLFLLQFDLDFTFLVFLISHGNPKMITVPRKSKTQTVV